MQAHLVRWDSLQSRGTAETNGQVLLGATMIKGTVGERFTYTASGMVTNIASRLCDLGNKGEIHLSETTAHLVQDHFTLYGPFEVHLKRVRGTLLVYQIA